MRHFRDLPIQRKLRFVILGTCSAALVVACGALFVLQFLFFRSDFARDLGATARMIGNYSTAIVSFKNEEDAAELLSSLKAKPNVVGASIKLLDGRTLATFGNTRGTAELPTEAGLRNDGYDLLYVHPIILDGERIGTLYLHADYREQAGALVRLYAGILAVVLTISFLVAVFISWRLEPVILEPIAKLAGAAHHIAAENDYSVRAPKLVDDELGSFTDSFNLMLDQIQSRDASLRHEIAERRRAESELQKLHVQLVDASRHAGMAEVATGVLHNVGNVLNSVNVSANLISERLGQSKTANLVKAAQLLREQNGTLANFLTQDPKGRLLPSYLAEVSQHLEDERTEALAELSLLTKNIEHIKDIVARQQSYARVSGITETLAINELIEDALRLNLDSLARHGITLVRNFADVPRATVDKHQVLQILVNIIRNAKHAIDEAEPDDRRLTLTIERKDAETVAIKVTDTGMGIAPENLTKIFSHGFTTRKDGHGFGLHTSALSARQMGGSLTAESAGPGLGATFVLELPLATAAPTHTP